MTQDPQTRPTAPAAALEALVERVLVATGVPPEDAAVVGEILVASDLRGIESHGVARLRGYYVDRLLAGITQARPVRVVDRETPISYVLDAGNGLGHPAGKIAMRKAIEKAEAVGAGFAAVRNSNHFGIAGYYAMMALERGLIGIATTNSSPLVVPTYGRRPLLGTNPFAFAIPTGSETPFVFDFATSTVPYGRIEVFHREGRELRENWAVDDMGEPTTDTGAALAGGLLPLGGRDTLYAGHKGFGLALVSDILSAGLSGGMLGPLMPARTLGPVPGEVSHWFCALRIDAFRDPLDFKRDMDRELREIKDSPRAAGAERIYVAGEIEFERTQHRLRHGIPLHASVWNDLKATCERVGVPFDLE